MSETAALLGLGSNLGDRLATLRSAVEALRAVDGLRVTGTSAVYESSPMGDVPQGDFLNAAVSITTSLDARELLAVLLQVEAQHGRVRRKRWGPRTLDLDLLWMDGVERDEPGLTVPHPGLAERPFVLRPVADLRPELRLPDGRTVGQAVGELDGDGCLPVPGATLDR